MLKFAGSVLQHVINDLILKPEIFGYLSFLKKIKHAQEAESYHFSIFFLACLHDMEKSSMGKSM